MTIMHTKTQGPPKSSPDLYIWNREKLNNDIVWTNAVKIGIYIELVFYVQVHLV